MRKENFNEIIEIAKEALTQGKILFALNLEKLTTEFMNLNIENSEEIVTLLIVLLDELTENDFLSSEETHNLDHENSSKVYAFIWNSKKLKVLMHLKFALTSGFFYYISLHDNIKKNPQKKGKNSSRLKKP